MPDTLASAIKAATLAGTDTFEDVRADLIDDIAQFEKLDADVVVFRAQLGRLDTECVSLRAQIAQARTRSRTQLQRLDRLGERVAGVEQESGSKDILISNQTATIEAQAERIAQLEKAIKVHEIEHLGGATQALPIGGKRE